MVTERYLDEKTQGTLTIQQVAEATGLSVHTLRYYEKAGLLEPVARNEGGHRRYRNRDVDSLLFLTRLRLTGMPIHRVREYAELVRGGKETLPARLKLLQDHRIAIVAQMAELEKNLAAVDFKIGLYDQGWVFTSEDDPCLAQLRGLMKGEKI